MVEIYIEEVGNNFTDMEGKGLVGFATTPPTCLQTQNPSKCWRLRIVNGLGLIEALLTWARNIDFSCA
jgi:hypothetical protein